MASHPGARPPGRRRVLPRGTPLPDDVWALRHRVFLAAAWAAAAVVLAWGTLSHGLAHGVLDALPVAVPSLLATVVSVGARRWRREAASSTVMLALMMAAAVVVHLSHGLIEAHFLFFVAVGAAAAYQTWAPFLTAVGFVVVHHGLLGPLSGQEIFNHPAAQERPMVWALVHGALLAGGAAVGVASWRADEVVRERLATVGARSRLIVRTVEDGIVAVDARGRVVEANPSAERLVGTGPLAGRRLADLLLDGGASLAAGSSLLRTPTGTPVAVTVAPVQGDDAVSAVVTVRDLTVAARAASAEQALADLVVREEAQRRDVAALMAAVRPPALAVEGLETAVAYEPAASAPAGGDLYDWQRLPSGEVLVVVVDAMGRGTAATREALAVTTTVRTLAVAGCPLGDLVSRASAVLAVTHPDLLATLLVAVVDPATGRLRLAGGGHPPAVLVTAAGARELQADGLGVGFPDAGSSGTTEHVLAEGDTLVLYTDGLVEGTRDVTAGLLELARAAAAMPAAPVGQFARRLLTDVSTCALQEDDCLAVVVRRPVVTSDRAAPARWVPAGGDRSGADDRVPALVPSAGRGPGPS
ncbi:PP2C family protein-serine/threonine phosphatase [Aquipuribacter hungaricus]|uniref:PP2C family protein-serine/threonine phosphatase n=1 Tax=Aquipuribacter hungaricus TaxID=545624 RepID=A0ABV7WLS9_9MICO